MRLGAVRLRPVISADYDHIYRWSTDPANAWRWRYRGGTPSPDTVVRQLWDGVIAQFCVVPIDRDQPVGLVGLYNANHVSGYCYLYAISAPELVGTGATLHGVAQLIDYAFQTFRLRKIYMESTESSLSSYSSALKIGLITEEGRLADHEWNGESFDDMVFLSISSDRWSAMRKKFTLT